MNNSSDDKHMNASLDETLNDLINIYDDKYIHVYLRIKAGVDNYEKLYEVNGSKTLISKIPEGCHSNRNTKDGEIVQRKYNFSKIFGPCSSQEDIFNELIKPKLLKFINSQNCTVMTYGVSSSGKTYTIVGTGQEPGMLPRSLEYVFRTLPTASDVPTIRPLPNEIGISRLSDKEVLKEIEIKQKILNYNWPNLERVEHISTYCTMQQRLSGEPVAEIEYSRDISIAVWVSFAEIYNEHIYDLLLPESQNQKATQKLKLGNAKGHTYVKNLTHVYVANGLEAYQVLQYGLHHLIYAKTKINDHSSRSHSIFTIILVQAKSGNGEYSISRFRFCDLAGAERSKKTMNVGDRLKESNNINTSLLVLGRCITGVRNAQKAADQRLIPFRESKLTQLFQRALSGYEDICMMVNVNPCRELFDETQHVLNFSAVAKEIVVMAQPKIPIISADDRFSKLVGPRSTEYPEYKDHEILEKEMRVQQLREELSDFIIKLEIKERAQFEELNEKSIIQINKYTNLLERQKERLQEEYDMKDAQLKREYRKKLKVFKSEYLKSIKENMAEDLSDFSTDDEEDEEEEDDGDVLQIKEPDLYPAQGRKRKHCSSIDAETITVFSSDEEDEFNFWHDKVKSQKRIIQEHHKTIATLKDEVEQLKKSQRLSYAE